MAKNKKVEETRTSIDEINDSLTSLGAKVQANQKIILLVSILVAIVVIIVLVYVFLIRRPAIQKADTAIGDADRELILNGNDSTALVIYQDVAEKGYAAGNRAKLMAAIQLYKDGKYEQALSYLKGYSTKDDVIGAAAYSLEGDCYVNLDNLADAASSFKKAIKQSDDNPYYTPFFMMKLARVLRAQGDYKAEAAVYQEILDKYPTYADTYGVNVEKELARANLRAGN